MENIKEIFDFINTPIVKHQEGDYIEEDKEGMVTLYRKDGIAIAVMPKEFYDYASNRNKNKSSEEQSGGDK